MTFLSIPHHLHLILLVTSPTISQPLGGGPVAKMEVYQLRVPSLSSAMGWPLFFWKNHQVAEDHPHPAITLSSTELQSYMLKELLRATWGSIQEMRFHLKNVTCATNGRRPTIWHLHQTYRRHRFKTLKHVRANWTHNSARPANSIVTPVLLHILFLTPSILIIRTVDYIGKHSLCSKIISLDAFVFHIFHSDFCPWWNQPFLGGGISTTPPIST